MTTGKLVTFEGIDGAGKSSLVQALRSLLIDCRVPLVVCGERCSAISSLIQDSRLGTLTPFEKVYLFAADRALTYSRELIPALQRGSLVLWDRYVDSALVYREVEFKRTDSSFGVEFVQMINQPFRCPDLAFYIDISAETATRRGCSSGSQQPYDEEFLAEVREAYRRLVISKPHYISVDGERPLDNVAADVFAAIKGRFIDLFPQL